MPEPVRTYTAPVTVMTDDGPVECVVEEVGITFRQVILPRGGGKHEFHYDITPPHGTPGTYYYLASVGDEARSAWEQLRRHGVHTGPSTARVPVLVSEETGQIVGIPTDNPVLPILLYPVNE